jgi:hypothetical protein
VQQFDDFQTRLHLVVQQFDDFQTRLIFVVQQSGCATV